MSRAPVPTKNRSTEKRKDAHLDLCATEEVVPQGNSTLFDCVELLHCALPEASTDDVDLRTAWMGKNLQAPLLMTGMTGGSERAGVVNCELAQVAEKAGIAFGVGSQRAMLERPELKATFAVRKVAPRVLLLGNVGLAQVARLGVDSVRRLTDEIEADGLAVHLNPAQELIQPEGDRNFSGGCASIEALLKVYGDRLLVKETGCGISPSVASQLASLGVRHIDVSGLGGTSWVRVEELRAQGDQAALGAVFAGWGIPTAAALALAVKAVGSRVQWVASGGLRSGLDVAKALALGAHVGGMALPFFRAQQQGGVEAVAREVDRTVGALRAAMLLTGSRNVAALQKAPRVIRGSLREWIRDLSGDGREP